MTVNGDRAIQPVGAATLTVTAPGVTAVMADRKRGFMVLAASSSPQLLPWMNKQSASTLE